MSIKKVFLAKDTMFYNSQCIFVEYNDVIKIPWFALLYVIRNDENMEKFFDLTEIKDLDHQCLLEWYIHRKHRNFYKDLKIKPEFQNHIDNKFLDDLLINQLNSNDFFYKLDTELLFAQPLRILSTSQKSLVKRIVIYNENDDEYIKNDINLIFNNCAEFISGNFKEAIKSIPEDSTYVFSDISKINILAEENKLAFSDVLIANGFRYNYDDDMKLKVDFDELSKKYVFKYEFFDNFKTI